MPLSLAGAGSGAVAGAAVGGPWGAVIGGLAGLFLGPGKAKAAQQAAPVDLGAEQGKAISNNVAHEGDIEALIARANTFNQDQNIGLMEKAMPGYGALSKSLTDRAQQDLADPYSLPKDVQDNIARLAGERGISAGTKGEFNDFSLLRDFGINSLQYGQNRISQAQGITGLLASISPKVNPLSPMSFYITPGMSAQNAQNQQQQNQQTNNADAAASNYNQQNDWQSIVRAAGALKGSLGDAGSNLAPGGEGSTGDGSWR